MCVIPVATSTFLALLVTMDIGSDLVVFTQNKVIRCRNKTVVSYSLVYYLFSGLVYEFYSTPSFCLVNSISLHRYEIVRNFFSAELESY